MGAGLNFGANSSGIPVAMQTEGDRPHHRSTFGRVACRPDGIGFFVHLRLTLRTRLPFAKTWPPDALNLPVHMKRSSLKRLLSSAIESGFKAFMKSLPVMRVRAPASNLSEVSIRKLALRHRIHAVGRMIQLEAPKPIPVARGSRRSNCHLRMCGPRWRKRGFSLAVQL
jgi:hypothetical protein